jgi:hypothetical protein
MTNQIVLTDTTHHYKHVGARITKSELRLRTQEGLKLMD